MLKNLNLSENAVWKQRYRAHNILWARIANLNPQRGLVCTDRDGITQLYAWNVATGDLRRLTDQPAALPPILAEPPYTSRPFPPTPSTLTSPRSPSKPNGCAWPAAARLSQIRAQSYRKV
jgi:hypothetical protein